MKQAILFLILALFLTLAQGQPVGNIGSRDAVWGILVFEIKDAETHTPIRNAQIELTGQGAGRSLLLRTEREGIGLVFLNEYIGGYGSGNFFYDDLQIKITHRNYRFQELVLSKEELNGDCKRTQFEINRRYGAFTKEQIKEAVFSKKLVLVARNTMINRSLPGGFNETIYLEKIEKFNSEPNVSPRETPRNKGNNPRRSSDNYVDCSQCTGGVCLQCNGRGQVHNIEVYKKEGNCRVHWNNMSSSSTCRACNEEKWVKYSGTCLICKGSGKCVHCGGSGKIRR